MNPKFSPSDSARRSHLPGMVVYLPYRGPWVPFFHADVGGSLCTNTGRTDRRIARVAAACDAFSCGWSRLSPVARTGLRESGRDLRQRRMTPSAYAPYDRKGVGIQDCLRPKALSRSYGVLEHALHVLLGLLTAPQQPFNSTFHLRCRIAGALHSRPTSRCVR